MKTKSSSLTVEALLERVFEKKRLDAKKKKRYRSDYLKTAGSLAHPLGAKMPAEELPKDRRELAKRCNGSLPAPAVSRYLQIIRWGIEYGYIEPPENVTSELGFPKFERQAMSAEWRQAVVVYETALRIASARGIPFSKTNEKFWQDVFRTHAKSRQSGRSDVNAFKRVWRREADEGRVPKIEFPALPSKKPAAYRLQEPDWPVTLRPTIDEIRAWLEGSIVKGRGRRRKKKPISVEQQISYLLRYGGYWVNERGENISTLGWDKLFTVERVLQYIFFTDPDAAERRNGYRYSSGHTQESILVAFIDLLRGPLGLPKQADDIENLKQQFIFERRRPLIPEERNPNEVFGVAVALAEKANELERAGHLVRAAIYRRDSLILALTMLWPRRIDMWHRLTLAKHVRMEDGAPIRICAWREETKPGIADQLLEIPPELEGLFRHYLTVDRPRILGDRKDDGMLFVSQGRKGAKRGTPRAAFRNRVHEYLGVSMGSHALRKIWAPRYLDYSSGDYTTVMSILDTSLENIIKAYRDGQDNQQAKKFVANTDQLWEELENGGKNDEQHTRPKRKYWT